MVPIGLRLYIVKQTIERLGGEIKINSTIQKGTIFENLLLVDHQ